MNSNRLSDESVKLLRKVSMVLGGLLLFAALAANIIGLSTSSDFSSNQIAFGVAGLVLITAGVFGRRFTIFYRSVAVMLLNIIMAVVILELIALVIVKIIDADRFRIERLKMLEAQSETGRIEVIENIYAPFVVWRANPEAGNDSLTISQEGNRVTPGQPRSLDSYRIFLLGGSAMWGMTVSDSCTIPFYMQRNLCDLSEEPAAVWNLAQTGYSSTQEVIELMLNLRKGNIPDLVIFYDGYNDVWGAYENGSAGGHHSQETTAARVEGRSVEFREHSLVENLLKGSNIWFLITSLRERAETGSDTGRFITYRSMGVDTDSLVEDVVNTYIGNCEIVSALAESYGFRCIFVWQPTIWTGDKPLTDFEERVHEGGSGAFRWSADPAFRELLINSYELYESSVESLVNYHSFSGLFDQTTEELYTDFCGVHVNAAANEMIADELIRIILESESTLTECNKY